MRNDGSVSFTRDLLTGALPPGIYRADEVDVDLVAIEAAGWKDLWLESQHVGSESELFDMMRRAAALPAWFGGNFDGLTDCLCDLSWFEARGWLVQLVRPGAAAVDGEWWDSLLEVLREAVDWWAETDTPMVVLVRWPEWSAALNAAVSPLP